MLTREEQEGKEKIEKSKNVQELDSKEEILIELLGKLN